MKLKDASRRRFASELLSIWEFLGPGNIGGRARALQIHPQGPDILYAAGVSGGVWRTDNARAPRCTALSAPCSRSSAQVQWTSLNHSYGVTQFYFGGRHVWMTNDGGLTCNPIDGEGAAALPDIPVHALVVDPNERQQLYITALFEGLEVSHFGICAPGSAGGYVDLQVFGRFHAAPGHAILVCHVVAMADIPVILGSEDVPAVIAFGRLGASVHMVEALVTDFIAAIDALTVWPSCWYIISAVRAFFELCGAVVYVAVVADQMLAEGTPLGAQRLIVGAVGAIILCSIGNIRRCLANPPCRPLSGGLVRRDCLIVAEKGQTVPADMPAWVSLDLTATPLTSLGAPVPGITTC